MHSTPKNGNIGYVTTMARNPESSNTSFHLRTLFQPAQPLIPIALRRPWTWGWFGHAVATWLVVLSSSLPDERTLGQYPASWQTIRPHLSLNVFLFVLTATLILLFRRRYPVITLAATLIVLIVSTVANAFGAGLVVSVAIAIYTCVQHLQFRRTIGIVIAVALIVAIATIPVVGWHSQQILLIWVGAAMGEAVRSQRSQLLEAHARADRAEAAKEAIARQRVAETRLSIARDLHDVVAHQIAVINLHAGVAANALPNRPQDAEKSLAIVQKAAKDVITDIGSLMTALRNPEPTIGPTGLLQLDDLRRDLATHGFNVTMRTIGQPYELPGAVDAAALRIIQEALTNAHKHGDEPRAHILLEYLEGEIKITVANPVATTPPRTPGPAEPTTGSIPTRAFGTGHGIIGMKERAEAVRGQLTSNQTYVGTWEVAATLPVSTQPQR